MPISKKTEAISYLPCKFRKKVVPFNYISNKYSKQIPRWIKMMAACDISNLKTTYGIEVSSMKFLSKLCYISCPIFPVRLRKATVHSW